MMNFSDVRRCSMALGLRLALGVICILMVLPVMALPRGVTQVTSVEGINEYRLKNGLSVLLFADPSKETVTVNITYKVGSLHEKYGETGMAHLLEHMLFKGSKKHKNIPHELSEHGANPNGSTTVDRTNYFETFLATEENIDWALDLEADRMVNSFIAKADLDSEMTVVRNEFERAENSPFRVMMQKMMAAAYAWHNNGKPTIGARADIENVSIERLQAFYKLYYQPDNAVLTIAGKFDEETMLKKVAKTFGKIRKPERKLPHLYTTEPAQDGEKSVVVRRVGDTQLLAAAYHIPAGSHPDFAALEVLSQILGDTPRGRLHKQLVEKKLAVATYAFTFDMSDPGLFFTAARLEKDADLDSVRDVFIEISEGLDKTPVSDDEVARAKANITKRIELAFNSSEQIAILLSEYIGMGDWRLLFLTRDRIDAVTSADVQRVAQRYIVRNNRTEGRFYPTEQPERVDIPVDTDIPGMLQGYTGRQAVSQGEAFDPSFDNIQRRSQWYTLKGGAKVALLPIKTRGESVELHFSMQYGDRQSLRNQTELAEAVGRMLMRGTEHLSREQLSDRLDQLKASMSMGSDVDSLSGGAETTRENLLEVITLLGDVLRHPGFSRAEFDQLKTAAIANLESSRQEPQAIVGRELSRFFAPYASGEPYYVATVDEKIEQVQAVKYEQLQKFHQQFYGSNQMQITVVGDFEVAPTLEQLQKSLGNWRSKKTYQRIARPFQAIPKIDKTLDAPDKENGAMVAMMPIPVGEQDADSVALEMGAYIFGGGFLNSRLSVRLRQKEGLSYSVASWVSMSPLESRGQFVAYAIFAPQNRGAVETGMKEELQRLVDQGITEDELASAKSGMLQQARVGRTENGGLARILSSNLYLDRELAWNKQREQDLSSLRVEDVNKALRKYIKVADLSFVEALDLDKANQAKSESSQAK